MHRPKTDASQAQQEHRDKGRAIKGLIVCWVVPNLIPWVFEQELSLVVLPDVLMSWTDGQKPCPY